MRKYMIASVFIAVSASAQAPIPPAVPDALKMRFFKTQAELQQAQSQAQQLVKAKQDQFQSAVDAIRKLCGDRYAVQMDKNDEPECIVKPEPKK